MSILITFLIIMVLISLTGLYVAAEFSAVSASKPRLAQMAENGSKLAAHALDLIDHPRGLDTLVAACQLGITLAGLILGFYGQSQLTSLFIPFLEQMGQSPEVAGTVSTIIVLAVLTIATVLLGELIPKNLGVQMPERLLILTLMPMRWSIWLFQPLIWFFNGSGALILRLFGASEMLEHAHIHSPEEIEMLVEESSEGGVLARDERKLLVNTLRLRDLTARKVMIPRNHMLTADVNLAPRQLLHILANSRFSRLPLHEGTIDKIVGFVHLKDLLYLVHNGRPASKNRDDPDNQAGASSTIRERMRPVVFVPETIPVEGILDSMQRDQNYLVIVADEYGGTAGMITVEDLFEEIIGEFYDEFDLSRQSVRLDKNDRLYVRGDVKVDDLNEWLDYTLPAEDVDTVGGLLFSQLGKLPIVGEIVFVPIQNNDSGNGEDDRSETDEQEIIESLVHVDEQLNAEVSSNSGIDMRVEKMDGISVREVSFSVTSDEIEKLHKHGILTSVPI